MPDLLRAARWRPGRAAAALLIGASSAAAPGCRSASERRADCLAEGDAALGARKLRDASFYYRCALDGDPANVGAVAGLGEALIGLGDADAALALFTRSAGKGWSDDTRTRLASLLLRRGRRVEAWRFASAALDANPAELAAWSLVAAAAQTADEIDDAVERLENLPPGAPGRARLLVLGAGLERRRGRFEQSERLLNQALALDPDLHEAHVALATLHLIDRCDPEAAEQSLATAARTGDSVGSLVLADFQLGAGRRAEAEALLREVVARDRGQTGAWRRLAALALGRRDFPDAKAAVTAILEASPGDVQASWLSAEIDLARQDPAAALATLEPLARAWPEASAIQFSLGRARLAARAPEQALPHLEASWRRAPNWTQAAMVYAATALSTRDAARALPVLVELVRREPDNSRARELLARAQLGARDAAGAVVTLAPLLEREGASPDQLYLHALAEHWRGNRERAAASLERALAASPDDLAVLARLATLALEHQRGEAVLALIRGQLAAKPPGPGILLLLGEVHAARGERAEAEDAYQKALTLAPGSLAVVFHLTDLRVAQGRFPEARVELDRILELHPASVPALHRRGTLLLRTAELEAAAADFEQALRLDPGFGPAANNLAWLLAEQGRDLDRALKLASLARERVGDTPDVAETLGWVLYRRGDYKAAAPLIERGALANPADAMALAHLGLVQDRLGLGDLAHENLARAVALDPRLGERSEVRRALGQSP